VAETGVSGFQRIVLLNHLVSRSTSHAPQEFKPPVHTGAELLEVIQRRRTKKWAIEYFGTERDDAEDEDARVSQGIGHNFIRLSQSVSISMTVSSTW